MSKRKIYIASIIGEILEWYDFSLYSFLSPVFAILFFPKQNSDFSIICVFAIFSIGFISRPIGGLLFGWLGDKKGRKSAFFISLSLMALATFLIGCLPTFKTIGIFSTLSLLILRLTQGFSCAGEFSISMIFLSEHATKKNYYFSGSLAWMGTMIGALLASLIIMLLSFDHEFLMEFGWRIPFFFGGIIALVGIYFRFKINETPAYLELKEKNKIQKDRWCFFKKHKKIMLKIFLLNSPLAALSYVGVAFIPTFLSKFVSIPLNTAFLVNTSLIICLIIFIPLCGILADKLQGKFIYCTAIIILILCSFPAYYFLAYHKNLMAYAMAISLIAIPGALIKSVTPGLSVQLAPLEDRSVVMSFSYNMTYCLIGGTAPLLMSYLIGITHWLLFPAMYLVSFSMISLILCRNFLFFRHKG